MTLPKARPHAGQRFADRFVIGPTLGSGGMGIVFRARDEVLGRDVALKILRGAVSDHERRRLQREGDLTASLQHPGIVRIHSSGEADGVPYLAYELLEGESVEWELELDDDALAIRLELLEQIARAVAYAHERGIAHRDLKPENLLVDSAGRAHVLDFGLGWSRGLERLTVTGALIGTPRYMSPEQATGTVRDQGFACDVWSLGVLLYATLTGQAPFEGDTLIELTGAICTLTPDRPSRIRPSVSRDLEAICLRCLAKEPGERYPDAGAFAADLTRALAGERVAARPGSKIVGGLVAAAILTLGVAVAVVLASDAPDPDASRAQGGERSTMTSGGELGTQADEQPVVTSDAPPPRPFPEAQVADERERFGPMLKQLVDRVAFKSVTLAEAEEAVRLAPTQGRAFYVRGMVFLGLRQADRALDDLRRADDTDRVGDPVTGSMLYAIRSPELFLRGYYEECLADLARLQAEDADSPLAARVLEAAPELQLRALNALGRFEEACALNTTITANARSTWRSHLSLARSLLRAGRGREANDAWGRATTLTTFSENHVATARCAITRVELYLSRGMIDSADDALVTAMTLTKPGTHLRALALAEQGRLALARNRRAEALRLTQQALDLSNAAHIEDDGEVDALSTLPGSRGAASPAERRRRTLVRRGIDRVEIHALRARTLRAMGNADEAKAELQRALAGSRSPAETKGLEALF